MEIKIVPGKTVLSYICSRFISKKYSALIVASSPDSLTIVDFSSRNGLAKFCPGIDAHYIIHDCDNKHHVKCICIDGEKYEDLRDIVFVT